MWFAAHSSLETVSQNSRPEWDAASACSPVGKPHPTPTTNSGSHFPPRPSTGNYIPFLSRILGCSFHRAPQPETASHSKGKFRDAASATPPIRKARPAPGTLGDRFSAPPPARPRPCTVAPARRRHIRFIASSARKEGHLMWPSSCAGLSEQGTLYASAGQASRAHRPPSTPSSWRCNRSARSRHTHRSWGS